MTVIAAVRAPPSHRVDSAESPLLTEFNRVRDQTDVRKNVFFLVFVYEKKKERKKNINIWKSRGNIGNVGFERTKAP